MQFDRGYLSPYFVTDVERMETVLEHPVVLIHEKKISSLEDMLPVLEKVAQSGHPARVRRAHPVDRAERGSRRIDRGGEGPRVEGQRLRRPQLRPEAWAPRSEGSIRLC